jgi:ribosomal protein S18 acetylase RimI-like enzyme
MQSIIRLMVKSDLPQVAAIHQVAFRDDIATLLGERVLIAQYAWFSKHFPHLAIVCEQNNQVIGFVVGAASAYRKQMWKNIAPQVLIALLLHPWILFHLDVRRMFRNPQYLNNILRRIVPNKQSNKEPKKATSQATSKIKLAIVAVAPFSRGQGVGQDLISAFEEKAIENGFEELVLYVKEENLAARRVYEKAGWHLGSIQHGDAEYRKQMLSIRNQIK